MKAELSKYLQDLGFKKISLPLFIQFIRTDNRECIVLPKGKLLQHHILGVRTHLDKNGWLSELDFDKQFNQLKMARKQTSVESISLNNLPQGGQFYTHKQDKDITAIASYYQKKVKTERLFVIDPQSGETMKVVRVTIL